MYFSKKHNFAWNARVPVPIRLGKTLLYPRDDKIISFPINLFYINEISDNTYDILTVVFVFSIHVSGEIISIHVSEEILVWLIVWWCKINILRHRENKGVIRSSKSKTDRQCNDQKETRDKSMIYKAQHRTKSDWETETHNRPGCFSSPCSI